MQFNIFILGKSVLNLDGTEAKRKKQDGEGIESFSVKDAFRQALNGVFFDEQPTQANPTGSLKFEDRVKRFEIAKKIWNCNETETVDLSTEEVMELKKCIGKMFATPEIVGFLQDVIEAKTNQ